MKGRTKIRVGLAAKLMICVIAGTAAFFTLFGAINLRMERQNSEELVKQSAYRVADIIFHSARYQMLHNDREALLNVIEQLGSEPGIQRIRIFNKDGRITFSTDAREVGRVVDKTAEACYLCHSQSEPLTKLSRTVRSALSTFVSTRQIDCQVPSCKRPSSTGTVIDGAMNAGSTWSRPWPALPW